MNNGAQLLIVSRDEMLLQTRALLLGAYFQVQSAGLFAEAELAMSRSAFDLVILCYSIPDDEYRKLIELCERQKPRPRILTLNASTNGHHRTAGDGDFAVESGPYELLKKTADMLGFQMKATGRATRA
jgi:DNA-binding response OmpR family regulator